ncbi:hypothetical protein Lal_00013074 [Lupinus albus]|nr:hypothetical protein Lal_00013074 [Lupinus albus]
MLTDVGGSRWRCSRSASPPAKRPRSGPSATLGWRSCRRWQCGRAAAADGLHPVRSLSALPVAAGGPQRADAHRRRRRTGRKSGEHVAAFERVVRKPERQGRVLRGAERHARIDRRDRRRPAHDVEGMGSRTSDGGDPAQRRYPLHREELLPSRERGRPRSARLDRHVGLRRHELPPRRRRYVGGRRRCGKPGT